jgi:hypothetical protein
MLLYGGAGVMEGPCAVARGKGINRNGPKFWLKTTLISASASGLTRSGGESSPESRSRGGTVFYIQYLLQVRY